MNITRLIKLDFYTLKSLQKFIVGFLVLPFIIGAITDLGSSIILTVTFSAFILNIIFSIAEKNNFNNLYGALPIRRVDIILSRYIFSLIVIAVSSLIALCIYIILSLVLTKGVNFSQGILYLVVGNYLSILFISIQFPIFFKFEYSKAAIMSIVPYIVFFAIGVPLIQNLMKNINFYNEFMSIIMYFKNDTLKLSIAGLCISSLTIYTSFRVSLINCNLK